VATRRKYSLSKYIIAAINKTSQVYDVLIIVLALLHFQRIHMRRITSNLKTKNTKKIDIMTKYRTVWLFHVVSDRKDAYTVGEL